MQHLLRQSSVWLLLVLTSASFLEVTAQSFLLASNSQYPIALQQKEEMRPLANVLKELEEKYHVTFNYSSQIVKDRQVRVKPNDVSVQELDKVLVQLLKPLHLDFEKVKDTNYILFEKKETVGDGHNRSVTNLDGKALLTNTPTEVLHIRESLSASIRPVSVEFTISGKITSDEGEALPGVSVSLKGTKIGTTSNAEGRYSLIAPDANGTLVFSFIGYTTEEVAVGGRSVVDVNLIPDIESLSEVVVVGYGTVKKSDVTGALSSVSAKQLEAVPVQNLSQALQGRAAGVDVAAGSFRPGEAPTIRIRGNRSLKASNNPLYVVDGIPLAEGSGINDFNPSDIESVEVLKDASATAIYGSRGANGVILVTTKKGKAGKAKVIYDGYIGFSSPLARIKPMSGSQHAEMKREAYRNNSTKGYMTPYADPAGDYSLFQQDPNMWASVAQAYDWVDEANRVPVMRPVTAEERAMYQQYYEQDLIRYANAPAVLSKLVDPSTITEVPSYHPERVRNTDWASLVLRTGIKQNHAINISGGSENLTVKFTGGYYKEDGIQKNQGYIRYSAGLGLDYKATSFLHIGGTMMANLAEQQFGGGTSLYTRAIGQIPLAIPYDEAGNLIKQPGADPLLFNPLYDIPNAIDDRRITRLFGSYYADITLMKGLRFRMNFGPDFRHNRRGRYFGSLTTERNQGTSQAFYDQDQRFTFVLENLLFYDKQIGDKHTLGITLLQSIQNERFESSGIQVSDLPFYSKYYSVGSSNASSPDAYSSDLVRSKIVSWMGRVNYAFLNKYLLTASARYDGASALAEGNFWHLFPSFALAWKAHEEAFLKNVTFLDELKVRAGYGRTGNAAVRPYSPLGDLEKRPYVWGNTAAWGYRPNSLRNKDLTWEGTAQIDVGIDFSFLNSRISGTIDFYRANTSELIMDRQIPTASGFGQIQANVGKTRNTGVEVSLSTVNVQTASGFKWSTDYVFAKNKEEIVSLYGGKNDDLGSRWFIGQPVNAFYDWKPIGVWQSNEVDAAKEYGRIPGQGKIEDVNNDKKINSDDRQIIGSTVPKWTGSLVNHFSYKGFDLSIFLYGRFGQMVASGYYRPALAGRYPEPDFINYWTPSNPTNEYPRPTQDQERIDYPESYLYRDGSFLKIRQATLSYTFSSGLISRLKLDNLNVYVTAYNPFLFTKYKAGDPEFSTPATDSNGNRLGINDQLSGNNLSEKSLVFGIRVGF
ncbi:TonB-dependent receptor [Cytophagaceae bacterium DM2B3-1]|uniref:TonB-dependent receptor n=1 Tax=Xanthocytophaga flava TaxID=3048013 RepID=A0ABT7CJQ3_9BACT|nr:TonB-dependent receptor [Xanthocytophaga flavus]MDJ1467855.1 TonB-dependent receptor [Xanthocytophaga flavus]MDJ1493933.1 TonB-dependent receptor [Xanthocytophaga flavus]